MQRKQAFASQKLPIDGISSRRFLATFHGKAFDPGTPVLFIFEYKDSLGRLHKQRAFRYIKTWTSFTGYSEEIVFPRDAEKLISVAIRRGRGAGALEIDNIHIFPLERRYDYMFRLFKTHRKMAGPTRQLEKNKAELIFWSDLTAIADNAVLPIFFFCRNTMPTGSNGHIFFDLPPEVEPVYIMTRSKGGLNSYAPQKKKDMAINGKKYSRYVVPTCFAEPSCHCQAVLFAKTDAPENKLLNMGYYISWDNESQPEQWLDLNTISIPSGASLKKFKVAVSVNALGWYLKELPLFMDALKLVGINAFEFWDITNHFSPFRNDAFVFSRDNGMTPIGEFTPAGPFQWRKALEKDSDMWEIGLDGKPVINVETGAHRSCPSYRGEHYQNLCKHLALYAEYGIDAVNFDEEEFLGGKYGCYCDRCCKLFKEYIAAQAPLYADLSMKEFAVKAEKDSKMKELLVQFKADQVTDFYRGLRKAFQAVWNKKYPGCKFSFYLTADIGRNMQTEKERRMNDHKTLLEEGIIQKLAPQPYLYASHYHGKPDGIAKDLMNLQRLYGESKNGKPVCFPYLGVSPGGVYSTSYPQEVMKYELYETFTSGAASGCVLFLLKGMDPFQWKYLAEGIHTLAKVEDVLWEGKVTELKCVPGRASARTISKNGRTVIFVSDYDYGELDVFIKYVFNKDASIIDVESGEKIADIKAGAKGFAISIDKERARLLELK